MQIHNDKPKDNKSLAAANVSSDQKPAPKSNSGLANNRPEATEHTMYQAIIKNSPRLKQQKTYQQIADTRHAPVQLQPVLQLQGDKQRTADMVRTVKALTEGLEAGTFAIGGSLALQMWHWALNPDSELTRDPGDVDVLMHDKATSVPMAEKMVDKANGGRLPKSMVKREAQGYPGKFYGKQMATGEYNGFNIDMKEAGEDKRWGKIESLMMPIVDIQEEYSLPVQTPEALLHGLLRKYKALHGTEEQEVVAKDIDVALRLIRQFKAYQQEHENE